MRRRHRQLTSTEITQLRHIAKALSTAAINELATWENNAADYADQLKAEGVTYRASAELLELSEVKLRALRQRKREQRPGSLPTHLPEFTFQLGIPDHMPGTGLLNNHMSFSSFEQPSATTNLFATSNHAEYRFAKGSIGNDVVIALGVPVIDDTRLALEAEAVAIQTALTGRSSPRRLAPATVNTIRQAAIQRPFILHIAAHREGSMTHLYDPTGMPEPVSDKSLAMALAGGGAHPAVVMLSFCDSVQVGRLVEHKDLAVVAFTGKISDQAAVSFFTYVYDALALGSSISIAFEQANSIARQFGLSPYLNPYSSAHNRTLST